MRIYCVNITVGRDKEKILRCCCLSDQVAESMLPGDHVMSKASYIFDYWWEQSKFRMREDIFDFTLRQAQCIMPKENNAIHISLATLIYSEFELAIDADGFCPDQPKKVMFVLKYQRADSATPIIFDINQTIEELREYGSTVQNSENECN